MPGRLNGVGDAGVYSIVPVDLRRRAPPGVARHASKKTGVAVQLAVASPLA